MAGTFQVGGLASGLDTQAIVDALTDAQRAPIRRLEKQRTAFEIQLSGLGALRSALESFNDAVQGLKDNGVVGVTVRNAPTGVSATADSSAAAGRYDIRVDELASAAKARSQQFGSKFDQVTGGMLQLQMDGVNYDINIDDGATLLQVAQAINASSAPVDAAVIDNGSGAYLTITSKNTGHEIGAAPETALSFTEAPTGALGTPLSLQTVALATNARFEIDQLPFERRSNEVGDAIPGVSLNLEQTMGVSGALVLGRDLEETKKQLETFIAAYNRVNGIIEGELNVGADIDRTRGLAGDPALKSLQRQLRQVLTTSVESLGGDFKTLADIGVKTGRDGSLSVDSTTLDKALTKDPEAINGLFSAVDGITEAVERLVDVQTETSSGILSVRTDGIRDSLDNIDLQITSYETRVEKFRETLLNQFIAMEQIVSSLNSTSSFLNNFKLPGFSQGSK